MSVELARIRTVRRYEPAMLVRFRSFRSFRYIRVIMRSR